MQNTKVPSSSDCLSPPHHSPGRFWLKKTRKTQFWCLCFFFFVILHTCFLLNCCQYFYIIFYLFLLFLRLYNYITPLPIFLSKSSHVHLSLLSFTFIASFPLIIVTCICVCIYIYVWKYILLSLYNVTYICIFRDDYLISDKQLLCSSLCKTISCLWTII